MQHKLSTSTPAFANEPVGSSLLHVGDHVWYKKRTGVLSTNYEWTNALVGKVTKTLALLSNGDKVYRKLRINQTSGINDYPVKKAFFAQGYYPKIYEP